MANRWAYSVDGEAYVPANSRAQCISAAQAKLTSDNQPKSTLTYYVAQQVPPQDVFDAWLAESSTLKAVFGQLLLDQFNEIVRGITGRPAPALTMTNAQLTSLADAALPVMRNQSTNNDFNVINVETFTFTTP